MGFNYRIIILITLLFCISYTTVTTAGQLLEQESYIESNPERKGKGQIYILENKIKFVADNSDPTIIFDLNKNKIFIVDNVAKKYIESSPKKYVELIQQNMNEQIQALKKELANMEKKERTRQLKLLEKKRIDIYGAEQPKKWEFNKTKETKDIAGLNAQKIELLEDGKVIQEMWVSNKLQEIDFDKLAEFYGEIQKISQGMYLDAENQDRFSKALSNIYKMGYPLHTVDYNLPGNRVETILSIKQADLTDKDFSPPKEYERTKL